MIDVDCAIKDHTRHFAHGVLPSAFVREERSVGSQSDVIITRAPHTLILSGQRSIHTVDDLWRVLENKSRSYCIDYELNPHETIAGHSFSSACLVAPNFETYFGRPPFEDELKTARRRMLIHDIIEGVCYDVAPYMGITAAQKNELELISIDYIGGLPGGKKIREDWLSHHEGSTEIDRYNKVIDRLDLTYRLISYEIADLNPFSLQPIWDGVESSLKETPLYRKFLYAKSLRPQSAFSKPSLIMTPYPDPEAAFQAMRRDVLIQTGKISASSLG